jgi:VanZ like family
MGTSRTRRWAALVLYVVAIYGSLPFGPRLGTRILRSAPGAWLLGPGLPLIALAGAAVLVVVLRRRGAPAWAHAALVGAGLAYAVAFSWLRAQHLERTHLPEYGLATWLAWRALDPLGRGSFASYAGAACLAAAIGYGDELIQGVLPSRVYDLRDVGMNALGAVLGALVIAASRAGTRRHKPVTFPGSAEIATPRSLP